MSGTSSQPIASDEIGAACAKLREAGTAQVKISYDYATVYYYEEVVDEPRVVGQRATNLTISGVLDMARERIRVVHTLATSDGKCRWTEILAGPSAKLMKNPDHGSGMTEWLYGEGEVQLLRLLDIENDGYRIPDEGRSVIKKGPIDCGTPLSGGEGTPKRMRRLATVRNIPEFSLALFGATAPIKGTPLVTNEYIDDDGILRATTGATPFGHRIRSTPNQDGLWSETTVNSRWEVSNLGIAVDFSPDGSLPWEMIADQLSPDAPSRLITPPHPLQ